MNIKKDNSLVIGQWKPKVNDKGEADWILDGRCIHFNNNGYTMYLGFMKAGLRHGWGVEIPIKSEYLRAKYRETNFRYGRRIIPRDDDNKWVKDDKSRRNQSLNTLLL